MPLELRIIEDESDLAEFQRIMTSAFSTGGMTAYMVNLNPTPEEKQKSVDKHIKSWREESDITYLKVIDTDLDGKMIAGAKWRINDKERTQDQIKAMLPVPGPDEAERPAMQDFMNYLTRVRLEHMGTKPFYFLHILVTDPEHHRRGAGAMLVKWGTEQADKAKLPAFLESSVVGKRLYAKMGFTPRHEEVFELAKYGGEGVDINTVMIRDPVV